MGWRTLSVSAKTRNSSFPWSGQEVRMTLWSGLVLGLVSAVNKRTHPDDDDGSLKEVSTYPIMVVYKEEYPNQVW